MTSRVLREYGLILLLVVVGLVSLVFYRSQNQFGLEKALDGIGAQMMDVVDDAADEESVARLFSSFKARVLNREIAPEQVEMLAVNVLNLSQSGETLSADEAEDVINVVMGETAIEVIVAAETPRHGEAAAPAGPGEPREPAEPVETSGLAAAEPAPSPVPSPGADRVFAATIPAPPAPPTEEEFAMLGERLHVLLAFDHALDKTRHGTPGPDEWLKNIEFRHGSGPRIVVDTHVRDELERLGLRDVERSLRRMEQVEFVEWRRDADIERQVRSAARNEATRHLDDVRRTALREDRSIKIALDRLDRYRKLEEKGVVLPFDVDSLERVIESLLDEAEKAAATAVKSAVEAPPGL